MGIHGLMKLLTEECPGCIKEHEVDQCRYVRLIYNKYDFYIL